MSPADKATVATALVRAAASAQTAQCDLADAATALEAAGRDDCGRELRKAAELRRVADRRLVAVLAELQLEGAAL